MSATALPVLLLLDERAELLETGESQLFLRASSAEISVAPELGEAFRRLAAEGATEEDLAVLVLRAAGSSGLPMLFFLLQELGRRCLLSYRIVGERGPLATAAPISADHPFRLRPTEEGRSYVLSRFAFLRRQQGRMVIESPLSTAQVAVEDVRLHDLCFRLARPCRLGEPLASQCGLSTAELQAGSSLLVSAGLLAEAGGGEEGGAAAEDEGPLSCWSFPDLLFHARSRFGRHQGGYGGTYWMRGRLKPLPVVKPPMSDEAYALDPADLDRLRKDDPPLTAVIEDRCSRREWGRDPITRAELGEFLFRTARLRKVVRSDTEQHLSSRPYPGGGASYELELYLAIRSCQGLQPGLYHYHPQEHRLYKLTTEDGAGDLLKDPGIASCPDPQILLTVTARFARVFWKYESVGYALILKDVGVLYQTMYLVAEAMGLAACALGGGNADLFTRLAGLDGHAESSVGEFVLGSRGKPEAAPTRQS